LKLKKKANYLGENLMDKLSKKVSRRDAMKILASVAGAAALANIPAKWTKQAWKLGCFQHMLRRL